MTVGPMSALLTEAAARLSTTPGRIGDAAAAVVEQLAEPLRIGVVGRVSAGKSTLVNVLLGQSVAPTGAGETTQIPCWFRHGRFFTATFEPGAGPPMSIPMPAGRLPDSLPPGADIAGSAALHVQLPAPILTGATIVDTPGTASASSGVSERTAHLLDRATQDSTTKVEVLLVVLSGSLHVDEVALISRMLSMVPSTGRPLAVAALTRIDTLDPDPAISWRLADEAAHRIADQHPDLFSAVVPVAGLIAETTANGSLTETDVRNLRQLLWGWDTDTLDLALSDARMFTTLSTPVPPVERSRVVRLLGLSGIRLAMGRISQHSTSDAHTLTDFLESRAGLGRLVHTLEEQLSHRTDLLKAAVAEQVLRGLVAHPEIDGDVAADVWTALDSSTLFPLELSRSLADLRHSSTPLPVDLIADLTAARLGPLPAVSREVAVGRARAWSSWRLTADGPGIRAAEAMCEAWWAASRGETA